MNFPTVVAFAASPSRRRSDATTEATQLLLSTPVRVSVTVMAPRAFDCPATVPAPNVPRLTVEPDAGVGTDIASPPEPVTTSETGVGAAEAGTRASDAPARASPAAAAVRVRRSFTLVPQCSFRSGTTGFGLA